MSEIKVELKEKVKLFLEKPIGLFINGEYRPSQSGNLASVYNPANDQEIAKVYRGASEDVDLAVESAKQAFEKGDWQKISAAKRSYLIYKFADLIEENREELAQLETLDNGKLYSIALEDDVDGTVQQFRYYAGWATKLLGKTTPVSSSHVSYTIHEPVGVVAQIIPWNFPLAMASWKLGSALAVGCTIVIKTAEETPLSLLYIGELLNLAGIPPGVVNILPGGGEVGSKLVEHKDVKKVAFTGSTNTGSIVMKNAADQIKSVTLELGGKSPSIIFGDANLEKAIQGSFDGIMYNHGQNCSACSRLYIQSKVYDEVLEKLIAKTAAIKLGDGFDSTVQMGPLVSKKQQKTVQSYIQKGIAEGATLVAGSDEISEVGCYVKPTIFTDVKAEMTIAKEEIFGPVLTVFKFDTVEEVIDMANDSEYGLAASVWTENIRIGHNVSNKLEAGTVWINDFGLEWETMPFGGYKKSGIGREMGGEYGLANYTEVKSVIINIEQ